MAARKLAGSNPMTNPLTREDVDELRALLGKATPGPWAEDDLWNNNSGTRYRDSQIIASNPLHPSHMDRTITVCDTLNAWHCFSEEDREANMVLICALYNAAPALLALASQSLSREAEIRREAIEECAKMIAGLDMQYVDAGTAHVELMTLTRAHNAIRALAQQPGEEPK